MTPALEGRVKVAVYRHFATTGRRPRAVDLAARLRVDVGAIRSAFAALQAQRVLVLEPDGESIRMAPPFSGIPTQHVVVADRVTYHANCAWDALGIPAALGRFAIVTSRCEQSKVPLRLAVEPEGPEPSPWLFHCQVPAARWWDDIVFT
jgi:hypothetical protein